MTSQVNTNKHTRTNFSLGEKHTTCSTHLIVDNDMYDAVRGEVVEVAEMERLVNDALAREGGVTVQDDRHRLKPGSHRYQRIR